MKVTRRQFLKGSLMTGAVVAAGGAGALFAPRAAFPFANSTNLTKWVANPAWAFRGLSLKGMGVTGVRMPNGSDVDTLGIPALSSTTGSPFNTTAYPTRFYQVAIGEFTDQLHPELNPTTLWGYWDNNLASPVKRHLAGVILTVRRTHNTSIVKDVLDPAAAHIRFTNKLTKDGTPTGTPLAHIIPVDTTVPGANQAQNRTATHLHGGFVPWISDGGPFDWWAPNGASGT